MTRLHAAPLLLAAALCGIALILAAVWWPDRAGAGWVAGFVFVAGIPIGSLGWLLIHRLTGGRWGALLAPAFRPASTLLPALTVLAIPLLVAMPALFPWLHPTVVESSVSTLYLNAPSFVARTVIILFGLTVFALLLPARQVRGAIFGALGLIFYGIAMTFAGVDWILALEPPFMSTSIGVTVIATQLLSALAFAALTACPEEEAGRRDLAGLLLALCLAVLYLNYMAFVVLWYGDVPAKIFWLDQRAASPWWWLTIVAMLLGTVIPSLALMFGRVRGHRLALQIVAAVTLAGLALYDAILIVPKFGAAALVTGAIASIGIACLLLAFLVTPWSQRLRRRVEAAHG
jgi:hypothetical protein